MSENIGNPRSVDDLAADVLPFLPARNAPSMTPEEHRAHRSLSELVARANFADAFAYRQRAEAAEAALAEMTRKADHWTQEFELVAATAKTRGEALADMRRALEECGCQHDLAESACTNTPRLPVDEWCSRCRALAAEDNCPECGSGMLNGNHIAAYNCSRRAGQK